MGTFCAVH